MGAQSIQCDSANVVVAGGQESMSQSVHALHMRNGIKFGNADFKDTMISDGLTDAFSNIHMGITGLILSNRNFIIHGFLCSVKNNGL
jgi:acetyl-CoA C-acetyltransferase